MTPSADRNLLFGLFALQNGMIDQTALVAAFHAWTRDKSVKIDEILTRQGSLDADQCSIIEALVANHLKRHDNDTEKSLASVAIPGPLVQGLTMIGDAQLISILDHAGSVLTDPTRDPHAVTTISLGASTSSGQRFRVVRPHARGGLGEVFVAVDAELNREVALKQILDHHADDPNSRTRFVLEAEITGGLEHPGIVPVYGLGNYDNGRPFYAMRFVKGDSLKEAIAAYHALPKNKSNQSLRTLELRKLLRKFTDVCNAIDYAHNRGVIHRDIKPANVIVGKHGETLLVDWGLAKVIGRPDPDAPTDEPTLKPASASGSAETIPGAAIGTPAYMSPEQAAGQIDRLGPKSDVYSLGATLYCLLTGRPPFPGDDLGAVLNSVRDGKFPRPRTINPSIDKALEAICLKAMSQKPADRYPTPKALADDIDRWAADEPVKAWREPFTRRARRWARRNRTKVAASLVALVAAFLGTATVLVIQTRANTALSAAKARETDRFNLALEAIKQFHGQVGDDLVLKADQFKPLRDQLLQSAADFYRKLEALLKEQPDQDSRTALGTAYSELGVLTAKIGDQAKALALHEQALVIRQQLSAANPAVTEFRSDLAKSHLSIGILLSNTGKPAEALESYSKARAIQQELSDANPAVTGFRIDLADSHLGIGNVQVETGKYAEALESYKKSLAIRQQICEASPAVTEFRRNLAEVYNNIGAALARTGKPSDALVHYEKFLAVIQEIADANPANPAFRNALAGGHYNVGNLLKDTGNAAQALESYKKSLAMRQELSSENAAVTEFRSDLAFTYNSIGNLLLSSGKTDDALESYKKSLAIMQQLSDANPAVTKFQMALAGSQYNVGNLLLNIGRPADALAFYHKSLAIRQQLADVSPAITEFQSNVAASHGNIGVLLSKTGRPAEALESHEKSLATWQRLVESNPAVTEFRNGLAKSHSIIGNLLLQNGKPAEALESYKKALSIQEPLAASNPAVTDFQNYLAKSHNNIGNLLSATGKPTEALESYKKALAIQEPLAASNPAVTEFQSDLALSHNNIGNVLSATGKPAEALESYKKALAIWERLAAANPAVTEFQNDLVGSHYNIGLLLSRTGKPAEALESYRKALLIGEPLAKDNPTVPAYQQRVADALQGLVRIHVVTGDHSAAAKALIQAIALAERNLTTTDDLYNLACFKSLLAGELATQKPGVPPTEIHNATTGAITALARAISAGYRDVNHMNQDTDLNPIRSHPDFPLLMLDAAFPTNPFADPPQ